MTTKQNKSLHHAKSLNKMNRNDKADSVRAKRANSIDSNKSGQRSNLNLNKKNNKAKINSLENLASIKTVR